MDSRPVVLFAILTLGLATTVQSTNTCNPDPAGVPVASDCCEDVALDCTGEAEAYSGGRENVIVAVMDDHAYCPNGFMGGRCAVKAPANGRADGRCHGRTCTHSPWINCDSDGDCPAVQSDPLVLDTCGGSGNVCSAAPWMTCDPANQGAECPPGSCGEVSECRSECEMGCTHGYCRQCSADGDCDAGLICVDGLCSPRAACDTSTSGGYEGGDFVCARGIGECVDSVCRVCRFDHTSGIEKCASRNAPCSIDADCNDVCDTDGLCVRTPAPCNVETDCSPGHVCTSGDRPLRLNDVSCRYRHPDGSGTDFEWEYDRTTVFTEPVLGRLAPLGTVFTPRIDALAMQGAVFTRARGFGQVCWTGRASILLGRPHRHQMNASNANGGGRDRQCRQPVDVVPGTNDLPIGCSAEEAGSVDCPSILTSGVCGKKHTVAWWLEDTDLVAKEPADLPGDPVGTRTIAAGKIHWGSEITRSFDDSNAVFDRVDLAKVQCQDPACRDALRTGTFPASWLASSSPDNRLDELLELIRDSDVAEDGNPTEPFFLWYAPQIPHEPDDIDFDNHLHDIYEPVHESLHDEKQQAKITQFDAGLDLLVNELKRTCVCGPPGQPNRSLWDHTSVILLPDNALMLPKSKSPGDATENSIRHALTINTPGHRPTSSSPAPLSSAVFDDQTFFPHNGDVLPTAIDYSGVPNAEERDNYAYNQSLRAVLIDGRDAAPIRNAFYGSHGLNDSGPGYGDDRHVTLRGGMLGLCQYGTKKIVEFVDAGVLRKHRRPCLVNEHCGDDESTHEATCLLDGARRCVNRPEQLCKTDFDCGVCGPNPSGSGNRCQSGYPDLERDPVTGVYDVPCSTFMECPVPKGICLPPMLKFVVTEDGRGSQATKRQLYDLNLDPDEDLNLLQVAPDYLGGWSSGSTYDFDCDGKAMPPPDRSIFNQLFCCVNEFWNLNGNAQRPEVGDAQIWEPRAKCNCPPELRAWEAPVDTETACEASP